MAAAMTARRHGLEVAVIDEQPQPGGQIWRAVENSAPRDGILGPSYADGRSVAQAFRSCGAHYLAATRLWQIERGFRAYVSHAGKARCIEAAAIILATGAQERPAPFAGWTLPGVMTVGAAQILLKQSGQIPDGPVWIAGSGPLPLLYMTQLLRAGGSIGGYLDTRPAGQWQTALRHLPGALGSAGDLLKGLGWLAQLRACGTRVTRHVAQIEALGAARISAVRYSTDGGETATVAADKLLVHEGVVPNIHAALSLECAMRWDAAQDCFVPVLDGWGEASVENLFIAGDGAGIAGAKAARWRGELAALGAIAKLGRIGMAAATAAARPIRRRLRRELAMRPFLDALFKPRPQIFAPDDATIVCRCEEVTAGAIRAAARTGAPGPNQVKAFTRAGMGPCQGRQCGYSVMRILGAAQNRSPGEIGFFHIRPPLKPITLGELAALDDPSP